MHFTIVTLFPEFFDSPMASGLMGRAVRNGLVSYSTVNPRDFAWDAHRTVDDKPYGGGPGLVMLCETMSRALDSIMETAGTPRRIMLTPRGRKYDQEMAVNLSHEEHIVLICGRYEGIDYRMEELYHTDPVCVGDFVLNGGETGAMCMMESIARLLPGFMHKIQSGYDESFSHGLLEYPHYTRPAEFEGKKVPSELLDGNHGKAARWRRDRSLEATMKFRPDMIEDLDIIDGDVPVLKKSRQAGLGRNLYLALVHYPVVNKFGQQVATSLTNLDIHDMSRVSRSYDLGGYYIVTPIEDQQVLAQTLLDHWVQGPGKAANPDRGEALSLAEVVPDVDRAVEKITALTGKEPVLVATSARAEGGMSYAGLRKILEDRAVLLLLGTAHGLGPVIMNKCSHTLRPIRFLSEYNHLPVRSAAAISVDRLLKDIG